MFFGQIIYKEETMSQYHISQATTALRVIKLHPVIFINTQFTNKILSYKIPTLGFQAHNIISPLYLDQHHWSQSYFISFKNQEAIIQCGHSILISIFQKLLEITFKIRSPWNKSMDFSSFYYNNIGSLVVTNLLQSCKS